jgi:methionyl-tRNA synthetase
MNQTILTQASMQGFPIPLLILLVVWEAVWKGIALWKSARNKHLVWFICIFIFNTVGILPIVYLAFFSKIKNKKHK